MFSILYVKLPTKLLLHSPLMKSTFEVCGVYHRCLLLSIICIIMQLNKTLFFGHSYFRRGLLKPHWVYRSQKCQAITKGMAGNNNNNDDDDDNIIIIINKFKVCKTMHHHTIQINQPTRCNNFSSLLLDVYVQLNMFRASSRPSSGAQQLQ